MRRFTSQRRSSAKPLENMGLQRSCAHGSREHMRLKSYDLANHKDRVVACGSKRDAKHLRLFTRSVHVFLMDGQGRLMVCQRPFAKRRYPGQITSSAGGHVERGETYLQAARRELKEELGIHVRLKDFGRFDVVTKLERSIHHLFVGQSTKAIIPDSREIKSYHFETPASLENNVAKHPRRYAKPFHEALRLYLKFSLRRHTSASRQTEQCAQE